MALDTRAALSLAYTPGVAEVCSAIADQPELAERYTWRARLVAVVSDGTAVLGLGDLGPAAALPVMEGKAALFQQFAGLDSVPIVLDTIDVDEIVETVVRIAPSFGAINLEDISAPRCFEIEARLRALLPIPVLHDDQHGTAIVVLAALRNAADGDRSRNWPTCGSSCPAPARPGWRARTSCWPPALVTWPSSTRAASCNVGRDRPDRDQGRPGRAVEPVRPHRWTGEAMRGADVFLGLSAGSVPDDVVASMAPGSIIFALANPTPEVHPDVARAYGGGRGHRPQRLPEPDQQRPRVPGCVRGGLRRWRPMRSPRA